MKTENHSSLSFIDIPNRIVSINAVEEPNKNIIKELQSLLKWEKSDTRLYESGDADLLDCKAQEFLCKHEANKNLAVSWNLVEIEIFHFEANKNNSLWRPRQICQSQVNIHVSELSSPEMFTNANKHVRLYFRPLVIP